MKIPTSATTLLLLLSLLSIFFLCHASVEDACKTVASSDPSVTYDFCVTSLQAAPGSGSADKVGLAVIATQLALANDTSTRAKIDSLVKTEKDPKVTGPLKDCMEQYINTDVVLSDTVDAIKSGSYDDAKTYLSAAVDTPSDCEGGFGETGGQSPLTKENNDLAGLTLIALVLVG